MKDAPEQIWVAQPDIFDGMSIRQAAPPIGVNWPVYTRDDLCAAQIAAALDPFKIWCALTGRGSLVPEFRAMFDDPDYEEMSERDVDLANDLKWAVGTPDDARVALERMLAEARREGWEAAKEAAAELLPHTMVTDRNQIRTMAYDKE